MSTMIFRIVLLGLALSLPAQAARISHYGPVGKHETLWSIAQRVRPSSHVTVQQTMLALFNQNPQAFNANNMNALMKGSYLHLPSLADIRRYNRMRSLQETRLQNREWRKGIHTKRKIYRPPPAKTAQAKRTTRTNPRVNQQIRQLQLQLSEAQAQNRRLRAQLKQLQVQKTQLQPVAHQPPVEQQLATLKQEINELATILEQKDNHIKTLQASLKSASEAIKSQHADNMRLYEKLKEVSPSSVPQPASASGKGTLTLESVEGTPKEGVPQELPTAPELKLMSSTTPVEATQNTVAAGVLAEAQAGLEGATDLLPPTSQQSANGVAVSQGIPLSQMVGQSDVAAQTQTASTSARRIAPLTWLIALASLLFILALGWRAYQQQKALKRLEEEESRRAERMRRRLEESKSVPEKPLNPANEA